ncbi:DUF4260 domain-containing protein [Gracilibacillus timonensis]|uniref:DUF4260 domain-containing protein n=1 Tax=Gracilibacillus timonensis TaxID=1816696 RepID=UPI000824EDF7|nr:DUF4260 domain-containing protein [Gracilibacillus timonensis]
MKTTTILRVEGLAVLAVSVYVYFIVLEFHWLAFVLLLLAPDLSMIGYMKNNKIGSIIYNFFHTYTIPMLLIILSVAIHHTVLLLISLIWVAHIGMDRLFGYGLKYPTKFQDTHLERI